jgi:uncharacterized protein (TIGR03083 family)
MTEVGTDLDYRALLEDQSAALRRAASSAGPDAPVPTCPGWSVLDLVEHIALGQAMARDGLDADPAARPEVRWPPRTWEALLAWWDAESAALVERMGRGLPTDPARVPRGLPPVAATWHRRICHETAIHRLDAEYALAPPARPLWTEHFAADGVDEMLDVLLPGMAGGHLARPTGSTPDAVYRALWGRPSSLTLTDRLLDVVRGGPSLPTRPHR